MMVVAHEESPNCATRTVRETARLPILCARLSGLTILNQRYGLTVRVAICRTEESFMD